MKITLVRHAEVDEAYHSCYNGHIDIGLSSKGEEQAKQLAQHFKDKEHSAVFCSDLKRCKQTLQAFDLNIKPVYTSVLREKSWGRHEGKSFDEIIASEKFGYEDFEQWINALDGEEYSAYIKRIEGFFTGFLPAKQAEAVREANVSSVNPYDSVLVMTHAGVIRVLMHILQGISLEEAFCKNFAYGNYITLDTDNWEFTEKTNSLGEIQCV